MAAVGLHLVEKPAISLQDFYACTWLSQDMTHSIHAGTILVNASAGGLYPMPYAPIYATAKAGCVHMVRSLMVPLGKRGIRISAVCPAPVDTPLVSRGAGP